MALLVDFPNDFGKKRGRKIVMGGIGSGRPASFGLLVDTCEHFRSIDLAWMRQQNMLGPGYAGSIQWSRGDDVTASISYRTESTGLRLIYRVQHSDCEQHDVEELIPFTWTATNFGGQRRWFRCPSCLRRSRVIYGGAYFRCRRCHDLNYESQYEAMTFRAASQRHKLRRRLGQSGSLSDPFPPKPKGMHWKTYERLQTRDKILEQLWVTGMSIWLLRYR